MLLGLIDDEDDEDEAARDLWDRVLERCPFDDDLAKHTIVLHGPAGLARVMQLRLDHLDANGGSRAADDIIGWWLIDDAYERWGKRAVAAAMRDAGRADPRIKALWTDVRQRVAKGRQDWEDSARSAAPHLRTGQAIPGMAWKRPS